MGCWGPTCHGPAPWPFQSKIRGHKWERPMCLAHTDQVSGICIDISGIVAHPRTSNYMHTPPTRKKSVLGIFGRGSGFSWAEFMQYFTAAFHSNDSRV